jgi:phage baseplate assembly protein W
MDIITNGYSDIDLTFNPHPVTKDLMISTGQMAVVKALKNLILTNHYEKPFQPDYGSNIRKLLFELMTPFTAQSIAKEIEYTIKNYERRATLKTVDVVANFDYNYYEVTIEFYIENLIQPLSANFILTRLR